MVEFQKKELKKLEIQTLTPDFPGLKYSFLLYGPSKGGKTTFSSCFPKPLFLTTEPGPYGGLLSIRYKNPRFIKINSLADAHDALKQFKTKDPSVETLVCSSLTYLSRIIAHEVAEQYGREYPVPTDYGLIGDKVRNFVIKMCELPYTSIFECNDHIITFATELSAKGQIEPDLPGRMARDMPAIIDEIFYMYRERVRNKEEKTWEQKVYILTCPDPAKNIAIAGDRSLALETQELADYEQIAAKLKGGKK